MVLLGHLTDYSGIAPAVAADRIYHRIAMLGGLGVGLFFVLSGFLITGILLDAKGTPHYYRNFYARRTLRIFPLYYAFLFLVFVVAPGIGLLTPALQATLADQGWYWGYLANYKIAADGWPAFGGVGHFWSLAVEEQFYLLWPLVVAITGRRTFTVLCAALVAAGPVVRFSLWSAGLPPIANIITPARMDALALGALIAVIARSPDGLARIRRFVGPAGAVAAAALAGLLLWVGGWNPREPVIPIAGRTLTSFASAGLIALAITARPESWVQRLLANPFLVYYGVISYGLYVFHPPILILLSGAGVSVGLLPTIWGSQLPGQILFILIGTAAATMVAAASFRFFESPILRLKDRFGPSRSVLRRTTGAPGSVVAMRRDRYPMSTVDWKPGDADRRRAPRGAA